MPNENVFSDADYQTLQSTLTRPNIFLCSGSGQYEVRHSNFIAWLLNPNETHQQKDLFLRAFLRAIGSDSAENFDDFEIHRETKYNIDIFIRLGKTVLVIENKVKAKDSVGQLAKYRTKIETGYEAHSINFIYWTLHGDDPTDQVEGENWNRYSYQQFIDVLESVLFEINEPRVKMYIEDYIEALKIEHLKNTDYVRLAKTIVERYKFDLSPIFANLDNYSFANQLTLGFLMKNSSYVKGNGFFSNDKQYAELFANACVKNGYTLHPRGDKQSTFFSFSPKAEMQFMEAFGYTFRFDEEKSSLQCFFGVAPETPDNKEARDLVLNNREKFHHLTDESGNILKIISRGKKHIGLVQVKIAFNPLTIPNEQVGEKINELIKEQIKPFTERVSGVLKELTL
jgi:hypothetical protein